MKKTLTVAAATVLALAVPASSQADLPTQFRGNPPTTESYVGWSVASQNADCTVASGRPEFTAGKSRNNNTLVTNTQDRTQTFAGASDPTNDVVTVSEHVSTSVRTTVVERSFRALAAEGSLSQQYAATSADSECADLAGYVGASVAALVPVAHKGRITVDLTVGSQRAATAMVYLINLTTLEIRFTTVRAGSHSAASIPVRTPGKYAVAVDVNAPTSLATTTDSALTFAVTGTFTKAGTR